MVDGGRNTSSTRGLVPFCIVLAAALVVSSVHSRSVAKRAARLEARVDSLMKSVLSTSDHEHALIDSVAPGSSPRDWEEQPDDMETGINKFEIAALRRRGLVDPVTDLRQDLLKHRELIPFKGSEGSTMIFPGEQSIRVLGDRWVYAYFEDGHNGGHLLLEFTVDHGKIRWRRLAAAMNS